MNDRARSVLGIGALVVVGLVIGALAIGVGGGRDLQTRAVRITGVDCARSIGGTGALIGGDLVLTSGHVVVGATGLSVSLDNGEQLPGEVLHVDRVLDVAVMRVPGLNLEPVTFGDASAGDKGVVAILEPRDWPDRSLQVTLEPYAVERRIRATTDNVGRTEQIIRPTLELDADIERGDSGALMFDRDGVAVGLVWSTSRGAKNIGYAVRGNQLEAVLDAAQQSPSGPGGC